MNIKLLRLLFFLLTFALHFNGSTAQVKQYINKNESFAQELSKQYGIPASVILGTAILESGSGKSRNARLLNNHFGIVGKNALLKHSPPIRSRYKQYPDVASSYRDFCKLISRKKFYTTLKGSDDYKKWTSCISECGYSRMPQTWKSRVDKTIASYQLQNFDAVTHE